jgi:serine/threonine protein kinase, bacterial
VFREGMEPCPGYRLTKPLGTGGFGVVWEGKATSDGARVAFKFLNCADQSANFVVNEIRLLVNLKAVRHKHLIELYNVVASPNHIILCMERADWNLSDLHRAYRQQAHVNVPPKLLCDWMDQAADALDFLATQKLQKSLPGATGLQHCDVKPTNLLVHDNVLKVADFGLSGPQMWDQRNSYFVGTPPYAAPEMYEGRITDRIDQYALAVTYYELRSGRYPFPVSDKLKPPTMPPDLRMLTNEKERAVLLRAMHRNWMDRYPNCQSFAIAIREAIEPSGAEPIPVNAPATALA